MKKALLLLAVLLSFSFSTAWAYLPPVGCVGGTYSLGFSSPYYGSYWYSSDPSVATVDSFTGVVHALAPGTTTFYLPWGLAVFIMPFTVYPSLPPFSVPDTLCLGTSVSLSSPSPGGIWSTVDTGTIAVDSLSGVVTAMNWGIANILYMNGGACADHFVYVAGNTTDTILGGYSSVCVGSSITHAILGPADTSGTWSSTDTSIARVIRVSGSLAPMAIITGVSAGSVTISYNYTSLPTTSGCVTNIVRYRHILVDAMHFVSSISGADTICLGSSVTLSDTAAGGYWTIGDPTIASVTPYYSTPGSVAGLSIGTTQITYSYNGHCAGVFYSNSTTKTISVIAGDTAAAISGPAIVCPGISTSLSDTTTGGLWSTSAASIVSVDPLGNITGVSSGTATISYSLSGVCAGPPAVHNITVPSLVTAGSISGPATVCQTAGVAFSGGGASGIWSSADAATATVSGTGMVYGLSGGTVLISYSVAGACNTDVATAPITVIPLVTAGTISGPSFVCAGSTISLYETVSGGVWSSSLPLAATVDTSGRVAGVAAGSVLISYSVVGACNTAVTTTPVSVGALVSPGSISGLTTVVAGSVIGLSETVTGGTWSVSPVTVATIDALSGMLTGFAAGTATVSYTVTGCGGPLSATYTVAVTPVDGIAGDINFSSATYTGPVKVWLIAYAPPFLSAVDSTTVSSFGASAHYLFTGVPTGTYRVKAAVPYTSATTGYIPTYHNSSFYWNTADTLDHTSGTYDVGQDISMAYGSVTSGPGFISGDVSAGANKGTTSYIPVSGLMMYVFNATSLQLIQAVRTDASGHYSFSNLPVGASYYIFPDSLNYLTTPYAGIALTSSSPTMTAAGFHQFTISHTIKPIGVGVTDVTASASILAFPNPTNGKVNIIWNMPSAEEATIVVSDITGREVFYSNINMTAGAGVNQIDLSSLTSGLYTISVKSAVINYNNKIQVQH